MPRRPVRPLRSRVNVSDCAATRVRVVLHDSNGIDETVLLKTGIDAVIKISNEMLHLLVGLNADQYAAEMRAQLAVPVAA